MGWIDPKSPWKCAVALLLLLVLSPLIARAGEKQPFQLSEGYRSLLSQDMPLHLIVKFSDGTRVRPAADGVRLVGSTPVIEAANEMAVRLGIRFTPLFRVPEEDLQRYRQRVLREAGYTPPDFASFIRISFAPSASAEDIERVGKSLQSFNEVEYVYATTGVFSPPGDIPPQTPSFEAKQGYLESDPGMDVRYAWSQGLTGRGVRLYDVEWNWNLQHEDLQQASVTLEQVPFSLDSDLELVNHGTAVLGMLAADSDLAGGSDPPGVTGMIHEADFLLFPIETRSLADGHSALFRALSKAARGDVVLVEIELQGPTIGCQEGEKDCGNVLPEYDPALWELIRSATHGGVIVIEAAGNGRQDLDHPAYADYRALGDSGAIVVGAGSNTADHSKLDFSTYGSRVDVQGWGEGVMTLGYGSLPGWGGDQNQYYTEIFNGTSSAAPFAAAGAVMLQQLAQELTGAPFSPARIRRILKRTGIVVESSEDIGPFLNLRAAIENARVLNDDFELAAPLTGPSGQASGHSTHASREEGETAHSMDGTIGGRSVWWRWVAPASGRVTFDTHGSAFDTHLAAYTGVDIASLVEVERGDEAGGTESIAFDAIAGAAYHIAVDGPGGEISIHWDLVPTADLALTVADLSDPIPRGGVALYQLRIQNRGSSAATATKLTVNLAAGLNFLRSEPVGLCAFHSGALVCELGDLPQDRTVTVTIAATAATGGIATLKGKVSSLVLDPDGSNNEWSESTFVSAPGVFIQTKLTAGEPSAEALFGWALALSGETLFAGAPGFSTGGAAFLFRESKHGWFESSRLVASDASLGASFGVSLDVRGDLLVIGAYRSGAAGGAYIFQRDGDQWIEKQKLVPSDGNSSRDEFGAAVAILDDTIVVGAHDRCGGCPEGEEAVYLFTRQDSIWIEAQKLTPADYARDMLFGSTLAVEEDTIAVGAQYSGSTGAAYLFQRTAAGWVQVQRLAGRALSERFGTDVAISGDTLIVGAPGAHDRATEAGAVYVFKKVDGLWIEVKKLYASDPRPFGFFGYSVQLDGGRLVVGALEAQGNGGAHLFEGSGDTWVHKRKLIPSDGIANEVFGASVALEGSRTAVGSYGDRQQGKNAGAVYVYDDLSSLSMVALTEPVAAESYARGDSISLRWTTAHIAPQEPMALCMKRDSVPPSQSLPDGKDWHCFGEATPNDGTETVTIPAGLTPADDWRFQIRHSASGAYDMSDSSFALLETPPSCSEGGGLCFHTVSPCRLLDTRMIGQEPALESGVVRSLVATGICGIPVTAKALALNMTVVGATGAGWLTIYPSDGSRPLASAINFSTGLVRSNNAIVSLSADGTGGMSLFPFVGGTGEVHAVLDVNGYFE